MSWKPNNKTPQVINSNKAKFISICVCVCVYRKHTLKAEAVSLRTQQT